ncbi:cap-specific mRNA (nucleoside-2'-O-)-methyltransferase 1-like, partial [Mobula birostris]|uniref:cap-specific mRNA (nucleoside-2'-O-)-methyltransferase 1-like n=1 Tax=Mobula birostris TaxID=1983395 RepID=UPI003B285900
GHFVCKTFDLFTPFSAGLIYLLFLCFERVSLFKPITSRPANSERYVVCRSLREGTDAVREYLFAVNVKLNQLRGSDQDVTSLVPLTVLKAHQPFSQYLCTSNQSHAVLQVKALAKIHAFIRDPNLNELRQADLRKECLTLWGIPDKARVAPSSTDPRTRFLQLIQGSEVDTFGHRATPLTTETIHRISHLLNYRCLVAGGEQYFLLGAGVSLGTGKVGRSLCGWKESCGEGGNSQATRDEDAWCWWVWGRSRVSTQRLLRDGEMFPSGRVCHT